MLNVPQALRHQGNAFTWGLCYVKVNFLMLRRHSGHRKARVLKETRKALVASTVQWEPTRAEASTRPDKYTALCPILSSFIIGSHCRFFKWPRKVHWLELSSSNFLVCWPIFSTKSRGVDCQLACSRKLLCRRWGLQFCTAYAASSFAVRLQQRRLLLLQAPTHHTVGLQNTVVAVSHQMYFVVMSFEQQ